MAAGTTFTIKLDADASQAMLKLSQFATQITGLFANLVPVLSGLASVGSALHLGQEYLDLAGQLGRLSQETGLTVEQMAGLAYAANQVHVPVETLTKGMKTFSEHLVKTGQGSKDLKQALLEEAKAFEQLPNGAAKATRAVELFGRSGLAMIPLLNKGPAELQAMFDRGEMLTGIDKATVLTASEFSHALKDSKLAAESLAGALLVMVLPAITKMLHSMTDGIIALRQWVKESEAFKVSLEAAGVALAAFSAYKLSGPALGLALLPLSNLFGPIKSMSDFVAAIRMLPAALAATLGPIATVATTIATLTAVVVTGVEAWKLWKANAALEKSEKNLTEQNLALAESIKKVIAAQRERGELTEKQSESLTSQLNRAVTHPESAGEVLVPMAKWLNRNNSKSPSDRQWTKDELEAERKILEIERQKLEVSISDSARREKRLGTLERDDAYSTQLVLLAKEDKKLAEEKANLEAAGKQGALSGLEYSEAELRIGREQLKIENERYAITERRRRDRLNSIQNNFKLTGAEKWSQTYALSTPEEKDKMGPDPNSFAQQWAASFTNLKTQLGTFSQQAAHTLTNVIGTAIQGVSQGISGLIHGTMTWSQALSNVGDMILNVVIQALVSMFAAWVTGRSSVTAAELAAQAVELPGKIMDALATAVSSYGIAAVIGIAALVAGIGVGMAAAMGAFAEGGRPPVGQMSIVGERGPEIFVPDQPGLIVPNHHMEQFLANNGRGGSRSAGPAAGSETHNHFAVLKHEDQLPNWTRQNHGRQWVIDTVREEIHRIG